MSVSPSCCAAPATDWLAGYDLNAAWAGQGRWRILATDFAAGHLFLQTWAGWRKDPQRPGQLHFTAVLAQDLTAQELLQAHAGTALETLAALLAEQWLGLLPGVHRLTLDGGLVLLTLWIGPASSQLRQQHSQADSIYLQQVEDWDLHSFKALARHCRRGTEVLLHSARTESAQALRSCGLTQIGESQRLVFSPPWEPRQRSASGPAPVDRPGSALVLGAGLAGSAIAHSLALRGWQVRVLDRAASPAQGASGLPAGLFCPHVSPDDSVLSRLSRNGVQLTLQRLRSLCAPGQDWGHSGVLEHCTDGGTGLPADWAHNAGRDWSHPATAEQLHSAGLPAHTESCWHALAGWVRPAQLVQAQLRHPGIAFQGQARVAQLRRSPQGRWQALAADGHLLAEADLVVLAAGPATRSLLPQDLHWPLQSIRGQVTWGWHSADNTAALPPFPVNGNGNLVSHIPDTTGERWLMGSSFERDVEQLPISPVDQAAAHAHNQTKLAGLLPASAAVLAPWFDPADPRCQPTWGAVRSASHDRLPLAGPVAADLPGLWTLTALGARGLTLSILCAELIAARLHGEPLPLDAKLAQHLGVERLERLTANHR